jgi:thioredoxin reductase (NADPH)
MTEEWIIYGGSALVCGLIFFLYIWQYRRKSRKTIEKIELAKQEGTYEPVSLHPYIDIDNCIGSGACISACPEKDILGFVNGRAALINASKCVGHGACFHACPVEAISLRIGTESRGVELPHVNQNFETNVKGIFIAGELGGMGLIKNSVEQGKQAMENIVKDLDKSIKTDYDVVIIGAGPAGISAALQAHKMGYKAITLEQDTIGGTVSNFPRAKIVMTSPMDLPLKGQVKLFETKKSVLIDLWHEVIKENNIDIRENNKVKHIKSAASGSYTVETENGLSFHTKKVLIAIGRRGTPRKLGVIGEELDKVYYKLIEAEHINDQKVLVVGGGDSAMETAMMLAAQNKVTLSYRSEKFARLKPKNLERINAAIANNELEVWFNTNVKEIKDKVVLLSNENEEILQLDNDLVYIFAGGELPTPFLQSAGIEIAKRFGYTVKSHG